MDIFFSQSFAFWYGPLFLQLINICISILLERNSKRICIIYIYIYIRIKLIRDLSGESEGMGDEEIEAHVDKIIKRQIWRRLISKCLVSFSIILCLFLLNLLSANFGHDLTNTWLRACIIAFVNDTLFAQTLKTLFVFIYLSISPFPLEKKRIFSVCSKLIFWLILA